MDYYSIFFFGGGGEGFAQIDKFGFQGLQKGFFFFFCHRVIWKFLLEISTLRDSFPKLKTLFPGNVREKLSVWQDVHEYLSELHLSRDVRHLLQKINFARSGDDCLTGLAGGRWEEDESAGTRGSLEEDRASHITVSRCRSKAFVLVFFNKFEENLFRWWGSGNTAMHCVLCFFLSQVSVKWESHNS